VTPPDGALVRPDPQPAPDPAPLVTYVLANGQAIADLHPDDVRETLAVFRSYEGSLSDEDAMAHAICAALALRELRRRHEQWARIRANVERQFPAGPRTVVSSRMR
jgi:hypothetical protein